MKNNKYANLIPFYVVILFIIKIKFINSECYDITNNTIIETQWLNNIICLGEENYRYVNFVTLKDGEMVLEITQIPDTPNRLFYGIKSDGTPLFDNNQYFKLIIASGQEDVNEKNGRFEAEVFIVKLGDEEYLFSIGKGNTKYAELYDLKNGVILSQQNAIEFLNINQIFNIRGSSFNYLKDGRNYVFYPCINKDSSNYEFILNKIYFSSTDFKNNKPNIESYKSSDISTGKSISCFLGEHYIMCLFLQKGLLINKYYFTIGVYETNLNKKKRR